MREDPNAACSGLPRNGGASARRAVWLTALLVVGLVIGAFLGRAWLNKTGRVPPAPSVTPPVTTEADMHEKHVMESHLAGSWYPADCEQLARQIDGYVENATGSAIENVQALILPHAGYRYSGQTAAYALRAVAGQRFDRVIVMGPTHQVPMRNVASVPDQVTHYATPLGEIPLDTAFISALREHPQFRSVPDAHVQEHSVQIELPLLQKALGSFSLVPIVVGQLDAQSARDVAQILRGLIDDHTLVVASSDFTHYGHNFRYVPFQENIEENLKTLDMGAWAHIEKKDVEGFLGYIDETGATICGEYPIAVLLAMLPEGSRAHLLHYDTSGRIMNDFSSSVSYLAAAFTGDWPKGEPVAMATGRETLSDEDKQALLKLARGTLEYYLEHGKRPAPDELGVAITPGMREVMGAFVTLHEHGQLRGCIGEIFPQRPLFEAVMDHAINAGLNDHRFPQVVARELPEIDFEISALTPPEPVASYEDIVIGKHGMVLQKSGRQAVFLPQVAPEQGWDVTETLTHLSMKAGLPPDAWKEGASYTVFEAVVFGEKA